MLQGSTITPIIDPKADSSNGNITRPFSINGWNSVAGWYADPNTGLWHGFKRYSNGSFISLTYPGAVGTYANGINDSGVIVGTYYDTDYIGHGFIYHNGQWATLDFIYAFTGLIGITNSGVILGDGSGSCNSIGCGLSGAFLYVNGTFKDLPEVPNSKNPAGSTVSSTRYTGIWPAACGGDDKHDWRFHGLAGLHGHLSPRTEINIHSRAGNICHYYVPQSGHFP
jgi:hypothetical protein